MRLIKTLLVASITLMAVLACSNGTPQEVIVVTATPTETVETSETPTPHPSATPRPWPFSDAEGDWNVGVASDPLTGRDSIVARLEGELRSFLLVGCWYAGSEGVEVVVGFDSEIEEDRLIEVQYSFDEGSIETERWPHWSASTDKSDLFAYSQSANEFIYGIMNSKKLSIREEGGQTLIFHVDGLANALFPHRDKCNWIGSDTRSEKVILPTPTSQPITVPLPTTRTWPGSDFQGDWIVEVEHDPITNIDKVIAWLPTTIRYSSGPNLSGLLIARCGYVGSEDVEVAVGFEDELNRSFSGEVQYRFDQRSIETEQWLSSTTYRALFSPSPEDFIWQIMNSSKLVIREPNRRTLEFDDVSGLANALYPHRDKCDWIGSGRPLTKVDSTPVPILPTATVSATNTPVPVSIGGAPLPEEWDGSEGIAVTESSAEMIGHGAEGLGGTLHLIQIERKTKVRINLDGVGSGPYSAAVRRGGCPDDGAPPIGQFDYLLFDVVDGESTSMVNTPAQFFHFSLAYVVVVNGTDLENDPVISCGNIPSPLR